MMLNHVFVWVACTLLGTLDLLSLILGDFWKQIHGKQHVEAKDFRACKLVFQFGFQNMKELIQLRIVLLVFWDPKHLTL